MFNIRSFIFVIFFSWKKIREKITRANYILRVVRAAHHQQREIEIMQFHLVVALSEKKIKLE